MEEADDLIEWWNEQFETHHASLAGLADGVQYMQLIDALLPDGELLHTLRINPRSHEDRVHNLELVQQAIRHTGIGVELPDLVRLAQADEAEHFLVASALRQYAEESALRMDALDSYAALKARMEAGAVHESAASAVRPHAEHAAERLEAARADPKLTQRRDELSQLIECLQQELAKRMRALEDTQAEFHEVRFERELLFRALQRIEHICTQRCESDPEDPLAADLLAIIAEMPADFEADDDAAYSSQAASGAATPGADTEARAHPACGAAPGPRAAPSSTPGTSRVAGVAGAGLPSPVEA